MKVIEKKYEIISLGKSEVSNNFISRIFPDFKYYCHKLHNDNHSSFHFLKTLLKSKASKFVFPFISPKDLLVIPLLLLQRKKVVICIHDFYLHKGEYNFIIQWIIFIEFILSSEVVVFNKNVEDNIINSIIYKLCKKKINVFFHGIENKNFLHLKQLSKNEKIKILYIGRIQEYKGVLNLVNAMKKLNRKEFQLRILGRGKISPEIQRKIDNTPSIFLENKWIDSKKIESEIINCHLVALPYLESTQSGIMSDAFAYNTPCLITPSDGLINQGLYGSLLCSGFSDHDIEKSLLSIKQNPSLLNSLSENIMKKKSKYYYEKLEAEFIKIL